MREDDQRLGRRGNDPIEQQAEARVRTYNAAMPALVKDRADAGKHVITVDMYGAFTQKADYKTAYMKDGLHPNDTGYAAMANVWWPALRDRLPPK